MYLPDNLQEAEYWQSIHKQPLLYWQETLDVICQRHRLWTGTCERFPTGKNIVFAVGNVVIKLSPPFWGEDLWNEVEVMGFVAHRLPVTTPEVIATGEIGLWRYYITTHVPGELMRKLWKALTPEDRVILAYQHGELMAALHALPIEGKLPRLQGDWNTPMLEDQMAHCEAAMRQAGVPEPLLSDLPLYLGSAKPLLAADTHWVLLHGDLDAINMHIVSWATRLENHRVDRLG
jgi:hygromycin-B 7''-O-kinase